MTAPAKATPGRESARLLGHFLAAGARHVDPPLLQPADTLLDLYGEDIRARAYVTFDPILGELMLRPDFTVPVVRLHMADGQEPARYAYAGRVFRTQQADTDRPSEYEQVGFELFDRSDPATADAEVFALFANVLAPLRLRAAIGDMGLLLTAVRGLSTTDYRKSALLRHVWRPRRFRALLDHFGGRSAIPAGRARLLQQVAAGKDPQKAKPAFIGRRSAAEIAARIAALAEDAAAPPLSAGETGCLDALLKIREKAPAALAQLRNLAIELPAIAPAVKAMEARLNALERRGVAVDGLDFEGSYGRTTLEYYDGFVFGFYAGGRPDLPPVATGGRYDALTRILGQGRSVPAVGGVIRPALTLTLAEAGS